MQKWDSPVVSSAGAIDPKESTLGESHEVPPVDHPDHVLDWLQCIRSRKTPNASIDAGYQHAVAVIMAMQASDAGKRLIYDREKREIREG